MSRSERLLQLLQVLRQHRRPVSGRVLAETLGISLRTLYRDIASLQTQGADIDGEAGVGYMLRPGYMLPPLMFSPEEIEALVLGFRWVASRGDGGLNDAAHNALAKIEAVLPPDLRQHLSTSGLLVGPGGKTDDGMVDVAQVRQAIRAEHKLRIGYRDGDGSSTERDIWPIALGYFDSQRIIVAWCEMREGFRHFRTDRLTALENLAVRYPKRRLQLVREWRQFQGISAPPF